MPPVAPVVLIPVTDYGKFMAELHPQDAQAVVATVQFPRGNGHVRKVGHYAALTPAPYRQLLEKDFAGGKNLGIGLAGWQKWLEEKDVELVITRPGLEMAGTYVKLGLAMLKTSSRKPRMPRTRNRSRRASTSTVRCSTLYSGTWRCWAWGCATAPARSA